MSPERRLPAGRRTQGEAHSLTTGLAGKSCRLTRPTWNTCVGHELDERTRTHRTGLQASTARTSESDIGMTVRIRKAQKVIRAA